MAYGAFDLDRLRTAIRPLRLHWFPRLRSTNDQAAAMRRRRELFAPALVLTGLQVAGRGRGHNSWWSNRDCITATLVQPADDQLSLHQLPLICGVALRNVIDGICGGCAVQLKWPNDLVYRGRKLAGLLCERVQGADLVGIGVNVNVSPADLPAPLQSRTTSLCQVTDLARDKTDVLIEVVRGLRKALARPNEQQFASILREYDRHHCLRGRRVSVLVDHAPDAIHGTCRGLDSMGRLLVASRSEKLRIVSGHVQIR